MKFETLTTDYLIQGDCLIWCHLKQVRLYFGLGNMTHNWKHFYKFNKQQRSENKQIKPWMVVMDGIGWTDQM